MNKDPAFGPNIGHVHLTVSDLNASVRFYRDYLGFQVTQELRGSAVFLSSEGYHHRIGLNTWSTIGAQKPKPGQIGLYHVAIVYHSRKALAMVVKRLIAASWPLDGEGDHGVSESIYLKDPDGNGIELYVDRPESEWPKDASGKLKMGVKPLDLQALLKEAD
ncbi:VOC family protein [Candidatus Micrarchaeota archaeon]|nr:VOC family protein [Candidatus Micrarchaeota archaeon]